MVRYRYSEALLREVVAASTSMAEVMRRLEVPPNGGSHAHLRRRIEAHGISTSHFRRSGRGGATVTVSRSPSDLLVLRDPKRRRAHPDVLRRALAKLGVPDSCADCGVGSTWNGRRLTLQVDHVNGRFWDCRPENLRLLCPNCHSQTATYAGRNRRIYGVRREGPMSATEEQAEPATGEPADARAVTEEEVVELLGRVDARELTSTEAARRIGCHPSHLHRVRRRLEESGAVAARAAGRRWRSAALRETVIRHALANPALGPKKLSHQLRGLADDGCRVSHGTISAILREAGLNTVSARRSRLSSRAGVA